MKKCEWCKRELEIVMPRTRFCSGCSVKRSHMKSIWGAEKARLLRKIKVLENNLLFKDKKVQELEQKVSELAGDKE